MFGIENEYGTEDLSELQKIYQLIEQNRSFVLNQYNFYREKVKMIDILCLKLLNHQTRFKHELRLGILSLDLYQKKIEILDKKLKEQDVIKNSINFQFATAVCGGVL